MIYIENKRRKTSGIEKQYPGAYILDVTSSSNIEEIKILSPFYPHGNIPIPGDSNGMTAMSVEGVWQGLKVFESEGICMDSFKNASMKNIKRTIKTHGHLIGHQYGIHGKEILSYLDARLKIYLPTYLWVLENVESVKNLISRIKKFSQTNNIVLLDYNTNQNYLDLKSPLSHAGLIKSYIENKYPLKNSVTESKTPANGGQLTIDFDLSDQKE